MPAASSADLMSTKLDVRLGGIPSSASYLFIVRPLTPDFWANRSIDHPTAARADRICTPVIIDKLPYGPYSDTNGPIGRLVDVGCRISSIRGHIILAEGESCGIAIANTKLRQRTRFTGSSGARIIASADRPALIRLRGGQNAQIQNAQTKSGRYLGVIAGDQRLACAYAAKSSTARAQFLCHWAPELLAT
jgi:hypothetical protein